MSMTSRRDFLRGLSALAVAGCAPSMSGPPGPIAEECVGTGRYPAPWVYLESERIVAYFEATRLDEYRLVLPEAFAMPERSLVFVSVIDFYEMEKGATYLESVISVLGLHEGQPGFYIVTMPVTDGDSCAGGRMLFGYPKLVRRITLERRVNRWVGVSYAPGGRVPEFTLALGGTPGEEAYDVLRLVAPLPSFTLHQGRVLRFGGLSRPAYELEGWAPTVWKVSLGQPSLEFPREPDHLLHRLGVGRPLAGYWARVRWRSSITPR